MYPLTSKILSRYPGLLTEAEHAELKDEQMQARVFPQSVKGEETVQGAAKELLISKDLTFSLFCFSQTTQLWVWRATLTAVNVNAAHSAWIF